MKSSTEIAEIDKAILHLHERALLCGLLCEPTWMKLVYSYVEPGDVRDSAFAPVARAIWEQWKKRGSFDVVTVFDAVFNNGELEAFQKDYLKGELFGLWPGNWNGPIQETMVDHAIAVHRAAITRRLAEVSEAFQSASQESCIRDSEALSRAAEMLEELRKSRDDNAEEGLISEVAHDVLRSMDEPPDDHSRILSGFSRLDKLTGGFHNGEYCILAGRPSVGKTTFALAMALRAACNGCTIAVISLDMRTSQLVQNLIVMEAGIDGTKVRARDLGTDYAEFSKATETISNLPIYVFTTATTVVAIKAKIEGIRNLRLLIIDHIQKMTSPDHKKHGRTQEVTAISRDIALLTHELNVPVVVISQLRRLKKPFPELDDLRESGALEQDSDMVVFLAEEPDKTNVVRFHVAKQRHGPKGKRLLTFRPKHLRFEEYHKEESGQGEVELDFYEDAPL